MKGKKILKKTIDFSKQYLKLRKNLFSRKLCYLPIIDRLTQQLTLSAYLNLFCPNKSHSVSATSFEI